MNYELSTLGDTIFMSVPKEKLSGKVTHSPNGRYFVVGNGNKLALADTEKERVLFVNENFRNVDDTRFLVTDHPYVVVRDIFASGADRRNDVYLLDSYSIILFRTSVDAHVHKLAMSDNAEYLAVQLTNCELLLYDVQTGAEVLSWKPTRALAVTLQIDNLNRSVQMSDHKEYIYTFSF